MATNHGPKTTSTDLVFAYDMYDVYNSYKGEPTTNIAYATNNFLNSNSNWWVNSGATVFSDDDTSISKPIIPNVNTSNLRIFSSAVTTVGNQQLGSSIIGISPSTQYSMSIYYWFSGGSMQAAPYLRANINNNSLGNFAYNGDTNYLNWPRSAWIRLTVTFTTQANETGVYMSSYTGDNVGEKLAYFGYQLEQKGYVTPLVLGTRSNTNSLINIRDSTQTMNVSGVSFSSNGTFSFDGTNDTLALPSLEPYFYPSVTEVSVEVIFKATVGSSGSGGPLFENYRFNLWYNYTNNTIDCYVRTGPPDYASYATATSASSTTLRTKGLYNHVVMVYKKTASNSGQILVYANGSLSGSGTGLNMGNYPYVSATVGSSSHSGGNVYWMNGEVPIVRVYNRELSYGEVISNFDSLRGRFSI
jgi:hypothetical protein